MIFYKLLKFSFNIFNRARSAFKLIEIDEKFNIFNKNNGQNIVELGCSPGGWTQVIVERSKKSKIVAVDILDLKSIDGVNFIQGDFCDEKIKIEIIKTLNPSLNFELDQTDLDSNVKRCIDLVLSDIAPSMTGNRSVDFYKIDYIAEVVIDFTKSFIKFGGSMVLKYFHTGNNKVINIFKQNFSMVKVFKPDSSRKESSEVYIVGQGFKRLKIQKEL